MSISAQKIFTALLTGLGGRQKEVLAGRFGIEKGSKPLTLAALGNKYGVTRERVRQIEMAALASLRDEMGKNEVCLAVADKLKKFLKDAGGVAPKAAVLAHAGTMLEGITEEQLNLFLEASRAFHRHPENKSFHEFFYLDKESLKNAVSFLQQFSAALKGRKEEVLGGKYEQHLVAFVKKFGIPTSHAENYLAVSKRLAENPYGDKGLSEWAEIMPRTVRDRIYLALKKEGKPLHFRTIANVINKAGFRAKQASAPTVHNELIKDGRFVLVGRGTYALAEHGYEPGTAREVIARILKKHGPLRPKDVILAVQKERFFKPNTILVNLQNRSHFRRLDDGTYRIHEA